MLVQCFSPLGKSGPLQVNQVPASRPGGRRTVFVDRDGVVNVNRPDHVKSWAEFEFLPGALDGLALLASGGVQTVVVTNQAIVNRGVIASDDLDLLHARMAEAVAAHGGEIAAVLVCPHRPDEGCDCRKPAPGLLSIGAAQLGLSLDDTVLVGDHLNDLEAARRAGCPSILVLSGRTREWTAAQLPEGCISIEPDLLAAARRIVGPLSMARRTSPPDPLAPSPHGGEGERPAAFPLPFREGGEGVRSARGVARVPEVLS